MRKDKKQDKKSKLKPLKKKPVKKQKAKKAKRIRKDPRDHTINTGYKQFFIEASKWKKKHPELTCAKPGRGCYLQTLHTIWEEVGAKSANPMPSNEIIQNIDTILPQYLVKKEKKPPKKVKPEGEGPKIDRSKPPIMPLGWDEVRPYYEAEQVIIDVRDYDAQLILHSPQILGKDQETRETIILRGGVSYTYYSTFQHFVEWMNDNLNPERQSPPPGYVKIRGLTPNFSANRWEVELIICDEFGIQIFPGYLPENKLPIRSDTGKPDSKSHVGDLIEEKEPEQPEIKSVPEKEVPVVAEPSLKIQELKTREAEARAKEAESKAALASKISDIMKQGKEIGMSSEQINSIISQLLK